MTSSNTVSFTPGPWGYSFEKHDTGFEGDTFMAGPLHEEGGFASVIEGGLVLADDNENEANARLIAAAPALYEALEEIEQDATVPDRVRRKATAALKQARNP